MGNLELRKGRPESAESTLREALSCLDDSEQHPRGCRVAAEMRLGEALLALGRWDESEPYRLDAYGACQGSPLRGYSDDDWRENLERWRNRIHELYSAWGKPEQARRLERRIPGR